MGTTEELTHISLCAGYGGIDIGLKRAIGNVRTIAFSEIEAYAVANLVAKMEAGLMDAAPIWTNIKTFPWKEFYGKVDILSGGFPCQPFSCAGRKSADDDPRHLWPYIVKGIKQLGRPSIVFLENVEGIISSKLKSEGWSDPIGTPVLLHVFRELEKLGYQATASVFSAIEVSAPHQRKRVFILAVSNELQPGGYDLIGEFIKRESIGDNEGIERYYSKEYRTAYPAFRGQDQYKWEAKRANKALGDSISERTQVQVKGQHTDEQVFECGIQEQTESKMGRAVNGAACGLGTSELFSSYDNRTDELRMLGNGVVPDTATRAFRQLWRKLAHT